MPHFSEGCYFFRSGRQTEGGRMRPFAKGVEFFDNTHEYVHGISAEVKSMETV
jgi:hypothetical protein